ncbi:MAG: transketolase [Planctomycetia bacterium]|nr:transketolase [Planctomycetia bacterium]
MPDPGERLREIAAAARKVRGQVVQMSHRSGAAHLGSSLSCVDLLLAAYAWGVRVDPRRPDAPERDRLILSKGHAASALYAVAAEVGFFDEELLQTFGTPGGRLPEQPAPRCLPGIEAATGSLGHGLSLGVGMALASRIQQLGFRVVVIMSDGECNEGSVWEAAMFAAGQGIDNLTVLVDYNKWQATGRSNEVMALAPLAKKFEAFGWSATEVDGHDFAALRTQLTAHPQTLGKPTALVCHTIKGKGVSFMEDDNNWHYRVPTAGETERAWQELGLDLRELTSDSRLPEVRPS